MSRPTVTKQDIVDELISRRYANERDRSSLMKKLKIDLEDLADQHGIMRGLRERKRSSASPRVKRNFGKKSYMMDYLGGRFTKDRLEGMRKGQLKEAMYHAQQGFRDKKNMSDPGPNARMFPDYLFGGRKAAFPKPKKAPFIGPLTREGRTYGGKRRGRVASGLTPVVELRKQAYGRFGKKNGGTMTWADLNKMGRDQLEGMLRGSGSGGGSSSDSD